MKEAPPERGFDGRFVANANSEQLFAAVSGRIWQYRTLGRDSQTVLGRGGVIGRRASPVNIAGCRVGQCRAVDVRGERKKVRRTQLRDAVGTTVM